MKIGGGGEILGDIGEGASYHHHPVWVCFGAKFEASPMNTRARSSGAVYAR